MNWAIEELHMKRKEWKILFNLCLKYKQWELLDEYWRITEEEEE
jgi:hypothetical protein